MDKNILQVLKYFSLFEYPPTLENIYNFLENTTSKNQLAEHIGKLVKVNKVVHKYGRYAFNLSTFVSYRKKMLRSNAYFKEVIIILSPTKFIPSILFLGISGSLSMLNMSEKGDIDLFIICKKNSIWTTRFILLVYKYLLKLFKRDIGDKLCLNMIFAENGLYIEPKKQNEYIGHEILQLKPVINKNYSYQSLILQNVWIRDFFPNVQINKKKLSNTVTMSEQSKINQIIELILKTIQIWWLKHKNIKWVEKKGQLWLIQNDFERQIKMKRIFPLRSNLTNRVSSN